MSAPVLLDLVEICSEYSLDYENTCKTNFESGSRSDTCDLVWAALALPTLKIVHPHLRHGAVVLTDNTISGAKGYADLLKYLRTPENGFSNLTLPYTNGFEMSVYLPRGK